MQPLLESYASLKKQFAGEPALLRIIDGEVVALDETGKPSFNLLQNDGSSKAALLYYVFDVLLLAGRDVMSEPLSLRRQLLQRQIMPKPPASMGPRT
jgi:ATP-dependent DNA ligase